MSGKTIFFAASLLGVATLAASFPVEVRAQQNPVQQVAAPAIDVMTSAGLSPAYSDPKPGFG